MPPLAALFLQQCHFLRQAGHSEKVVSLFQAMVDFTFFKPDSVKELPTKVQVQHTLPPQKYSSDRGESLHDAVTAVTAVGCAGWILGPFLTDTKST